MFSRDIGFKPLTTKVIFFFYYFVPLDLVFVWLVPNADNCVVSNSSLV